MTLSVQGLNVRIAHQQILQDLSITFAAGKRTAIIGPNGAGKSTLLRAAAGLNHDYTGSIRLDGRISVSWDGSSWLSSWPSCRREWLRRLIRR
jgi:ABC-type cobalamin/Fe3+-siderophores transport system ATPase subunit